MGVTEAVGPRPGNGAGSVTRVEEAPSAGGVACGLGIARSGGTVPRVSCCDVLRQTCGGPTDERRSTRGRAGRIPCRSSRAYLV